MEDDPEYADLFGNDRVRQLFEKMLDQKLEANLKQRDSASTKGKAKSPQTSMNSKEKEANAGDQVPNKGNGKNYARSPTCLIKSPSDTTVCAPAMQRIRVDPNRNGDPFLEQINNFIASVHSADKEVTVGENEEQPVVTTSAQEDTSASLDEARTRAEKMLLEAEKFKAKLIDPPEPGEDESIKVSSEMLSKLCVNKPQMDIGEGFSTDDFFHLTCHIDSALISRIEKGEFVELEKLPPKDRRRKEDHRLEWVHQDGNTFLAPVGDKMNKITSFRRLEQAF